MNRTAGNKAKRRRGMEPGVTGSESGAEEGRTARTIPFRQSAAWGAGHVLLPSAGLPNGSTPDGVGTGGRRPCPMPRTGFPAPDAARCPVAQAGRYAALRNASSAGCGGFSGIGIFLSEDSEEFSGIISSHSTVPRHRCPGHSETAAGDRGRGRRGRKRSADGLRIDAAGRSMWIAPSWQSAARGGGHAFYPSAELPGGSTPEGVEAGGRRPCPVPRMGLSTLDIILLPARMVRRCAARPAVPPGGCGNFLCIIIFLPEGLAKLSGTIFFLSAVLRHRCPGHSEAAAGDRAGGRRGWKPGDVVRRINAVRRSTWIIPFRQIAARGAGRALSPPAGLHGSLASGGVGAGGRRPHPLPRTGLSASDAVWLPVERVGGCMELSFASPDGCSGKSDYVNFIPEDCLGESDIVGFLPAGCGGRSDNVSFLLAGCGGKTDNVRLLFADSDTKASFGILSK